MFNFKKYIPYNLSEKIRIIFLYQMASMWPSWESYYHACLNDNRFDVKLIYLDNASIKGAQMETAEEFLQQRGYYYESFNNFDIATYLPHIAVFQCPYDSFRKIPVWAIKIREKGIRILYIPYGIEITDTDRSTYCHFENSVIRNAWKIYTISDLMKQEYYNHYVRKETVVSVGVPKLDGLYNKDQFPLSEQVIQRANGRKIILWKVHFPNIIVEKGVKVQTTPYIEEYLNFVDSIESYKNIFFIFRPHPKFCDDTIRSDIREKAVDLINKLKLLENVYIDTGDDYRNSLLNADAIMIDRSALMVEAGAVGVPVIYMYNQDFYEPLTKPVDRLVSTYYHGNYAKDMYNFIEMFMQNKDEKKEQRAQAAKQFFRYMDGQCGERIKEDIILSLEKEAVEMKKLRLIFVSTGKVCKNLLSYTNLLQNSNFQVVAFVDNDSDKWGQYYEGVKIIRPLEIKELDYDYIIIATTEFFKPVYKQLTYDYGIDYNRVISVDNFVVQFDKELQIDTI